MAIITLLTDFGTADGWVGEVKGVLATHAPAAIVHDITHDIPPQDVDAARLVLARTWRRWPRGTVHLVVVDPGVGSDRRALAVSAHEQWFVGPDNGVLSPALLLPGARAVELPVPVGAAPTFHGRDVFAPAAARLAAGIPLEQLGSAADAPVVRRTPQPVRMADGRLVGEVIALDRFGNAITNLPGTMVRVVSVGALVLPVLRTYADVADLEAAAVVGGSGFVEIAVRNGSAAQQLGVARGTRIEGHRAPA
jgi:S-adenosyl-L-methionine hydrolase (adenosine-forming)